MDEEVREMFMKLMFSKEELRKILTLNSSCMEMKGWDSWAVKNLLMNDKVNKEAMYRVLRSLWYTNE